jgi:sulfur carrier protein
MNIILNGEEKQFPEQMSIKDLIKILEIESEKIAIEINGVITPKSEYENYNINHKDKIEIINAVGGG